MQEWISSPIGMHPVESGQWVLAADATGERNRLAAELADEKALTMFVRNELAAANATLGRLREVVPPCFPLEVSRLAIGHLCAVQDILYPPETPNDDR